jgi:hypothetical protein
MFVTARFLVSDYDMWKAAFDAHVDARIRHGAVGHCVLRAEDNPNALTLILEFTSRGGAISLFEHNVSTLQAIRRGGVEGGPHHLKWQVNYLEELDAADYTTLPYG